MDVVMSASSQPGIKNHEDDLSNKAHLTDCGPAVKEHLLENDGEEQTRKPLVVQEDVICDGDEETQKSLGVKEDVICDGEEERQKPLVVNEDVTCDGEEETQKPLVVNEDVICDGEEEWQKPLVVNEDVIYDGEEQTGKPRAVNEDVFRDGEEQTGQPRGANVDVFRDGEEQTGQPRGVNVDVFRDGEEQIQLLCEVNEDFLRDEEKKTPDENNNDNRISLRGSAPRSPERADACVKINPDGVENDVVKEKEHDADDLLDDDDDDVLRGEARLLAGLLRHQSEFSGDSESCDEEEDVIEDNYDNDVAMARKIDVETTMEGEEQVQLDDDERSSVEGDDMRFLREAVARGELGARDSDEDVEDEEESSDKELMDDSSVMDMLLRARQRAEEEDDAEDEERAEELRGEELRAAVNNFVTKSDLNEASRKLIRCQNDEVQRELIKFDPTDDEEVIDESGKRDISAAFQSFARDIIEVSRQLGQDHTDVSDFISKWHLNNESAQLLESLSSVIQEKVMNSFEPPRVVSPRNPIDTVFQLSCRNTAMKIFCEQWKLDEQSKAKLYDAPPRVQLDIMASFSPKGYSRQPRSLNKLFADFATGLIDKVENSTRDPSKRISRPKSTKTVSKKRKAFVEKWKLDDFSRVIFRALPSHKAEEIMRDFGPRCRDRKPGWADHGEDVNAIFVSFVKSRDPRTMFDVTRGVRDGSIYVDRRFRKGPQPGPPPRPPPVSNVNIKDALETDAFAVRSRRMLQQFCKKWNLDSDCLLHLQAAPPSVQAQVIDDFTPREDASNISKVFMSFLRSRRMDNQFIPNFARKYDLDESSRQLLESLDVVTLKTSIHNFAPRDTTRNYNPVFKSFTNGILQKHAESFKKSMEARKLVTDFIKKWKLNAESANILKSYTPDAQLRLIVHFKPRDATRDASKLFIAYAKSRDETPMNKAAQSNRGVASKPNMGVRRDERGSAPSKKRPRELSFRRSDRSGGLRDGIRRRIDNSSRKLHDPLNRPNTSRQGENAPQRETRRSSDSYGQSAPISRRKLARSNGVDDRYPAQGGGRIASGAYSSNVRYEKHEPSSTSRDTDWGKNSRQYSGDARQYREGESNPDRVYVKCGGGNGSGMPVREEARVGNIQSHHTRRADGGGSKRCDDGGGDMRRGDEKWRNGKRDRDDGHYRDDNADPRPRHVEDRRSWKEDTYRGEGKKDGSSIKSAQVAVDEARRAFLKYWKLDYRADEFMSSKSSEIQWYIMDNFLPREDNTLDRLSPLFMNYVKSTAAHWDSISQETRANNLASACGNPPPVKNAPTAEYSDRWHVKDGKHPAKHKPKQQWDGEAKENEDGRRVSGRKVRLPDRPERPERPERSASHDERRRRPVQGPGRTERAASRDELRRRPVQGLERTERAASRDEHRRRPVQGPERTERVASRDEHRKRPDQGVKHPDRGTSRDEHKRRPVQGPEHAVSRDEHRRQPVQGPERAASRDEHRKRPDQGVKRPDRGTSRDEHRRRSYHSPERTESTSSRDEPRRRPHQGSERPELKHAD